MTSRTTVDEMFEGSMEHSISYNHGMEWTTRETDISLTNQIADSQLADKTSR